MKIALLEAVSNRLRRIYFPLLTVLLLAWLFRVTAFATDSGVLETAAVGRFPGLAVVAIIAAFYAGLLAITLWPHERETKGEFRKKESDDWKNNG